MIWCPHQDSNLELRLRNPERYSPKYIVIIDDLDRLLKNFVNWLWIDGNLDIRTVT